MTPFKVYIHLILNTVFLPEWSTAVFLFCLVKVDHETLVCPEQLICLLLFRKNTSGHTNSLVFQHFCVFEPFPTMTVWFWDPTFHTEDNWGTYMQPLQKVQTLSDAPVGKFEELFSKTMPKNAKFKKNEFVMPFCCVLNLFTAPSMFHAKSLYFLV